MHPFIILFLLGTSLLFHVQFKLLLPDLHIVFSRGRSRAQVKFLVGETKIPHATWHGPKREKKELTS